MTMLWVYWSLYMGALGSLLVAVVSGLPLPVINGFVWLVVMSVGLMLVEVTRGRNEY